MNEGEIMGHISGFIGHQVTSGYVVLIYQLKMWADNSNIR